MIIVDGKDKFVGQCYDTRRIYRNLDGECELIVRVWNGKGFDHERIYDTCFSKDPLVYTLDATERVKQEVKKYNEEIDEALAKLTHELAKLPN
jgi:uncharacterized protein YukE